jgi:hypothetical protein
MSQVKNSEDRLNSLPGLIELLVEEIQNIKMRLDALESRESTRSINSDRVTVIEIGKTTDHLTEQVQTLVSKMETIKAQIDALETRENTRTLNVERVRLIELEKKYESLAGSISRLEKKL